MVLAPASGESTAFAAQFPKSNGLNNDYGRVFRTTSAAAGGTFSIGIDLGVAKPVDVLALLWHNLRSTDRVIFEAGNSAANAAAGLTYNSGELTAVTGSTTRDWTPPAKFLLTLASPVTARYWSITIISKTAHPDGFMQASRIFIGQGATFAIGAQKAQLGGKDMNAQVTTEVGETRSQEDQGLIRPVASLSFSYEKQTEMEQVLGQYTLGLGVSRPLLICPDLTTPYLQDNVVFGRAEQVLVHESSIYDVWSFDATVTSIGP